FVDVTEHVDAAYGRRGRLGALERALELAKRRAERDVAEYRRETCERVECRLPAEQCRGTQRWPPTERGERPRPGMRPISRCRNRAIADRCERLRQRCGGCRYALLQELRDAAFAIRGEEWRLRTKIGAQLRIEQR